MRFGRGIRLTGAGNQMLKEAKGIFQNIDASIQNVLSVDGLGKNKIRLGSSHYVAMHVLCQPIARFHRVYPDIKLILNYGPSEEIIEKVKSGELDLGVMTLPQKSTILVHVPLWTDTFVAVLPPRHPLCAKAELTLENMAESDLILPHASTTTRAIIDRAFRSKRISFIPLMETTYLESIAVSVEMALGISILPQRMFSKSKRISYNVKIRPITNFSVTRQLGLVHKKGRDLRREEEQLLSFLRGQGGPPSEERKGDIKPPKRHGK